MSSLWTVMLHLLIVLTLGPHSSASNDIGVADNLSNAANATTIPSSTVTSAESSTNLAPTTKNLDTNYVPLDKWFCGAGEYDQSLSYQMSESDCPIRMYEANLCCLAHDLCYMDDNKTQNDCDSAFCFCLDRTVSKAASALNSTHTAGCDSVSSYFCMIVQIFGSSAHQSAKALRSSTTVDTLSTTTSTVTTSTEKSTIASSSTAKSTTKTPAEIAQFITHNISLKCFDYGLSSCVEEMHSCMQSRNADSNRLLDEPRLARLSPHIQSAIRSEYESRAIAECSSQFCICSSMAFRKEAPIEKQRNCASGLIMVCSEMSINDSSNERLNVHFWTINIEYFNQDFTSVTAILGIICIFIIMASLFYLIRKFYRYNQQSSNAHRPAIVRPTDLGFDPWHGRHKRNSKAEYSSFANKKTSDASANSGSRDLAIGDSAMKQHLHASHRHHLHAIPMSSSKVQLISPDDNSFSSASTPSINSNE